MINLYNIVDIFVNISTCECINIESSWSIFKKKFDFVYPNILIEWIKKPISFYSVQLLRAKKTDYILKQSGSVLFANSDWTEVILYADNEKSTSSLLILTFYSYLVTRRTLLMHSSLIDYQGNGIMFLGPSGIGKTTQAELWNQFTGADILNGDMVFVRENPDGFYGYGSPWHGSSPYCMNAKVKLKALVVLEQASENSIRKLSGFDVLQGIMDQVFLPHWYPEGMTPCLDTLNDLLAQIPVYHLACRPDEDAVQLLKNELQI